VTILLLGAIQERDAVRRKESVNDSLTECTKIKTKHRNPGKVMDCTNKGEQYMEVTKQILSQCEG